MMIVHLMCGHFSEIERKIEECNDMVNKNDVKNVVYEAECATYL